MLTDIRVLLSRDQLSPPLFSAIIAAIAYLETGSAAQGTRDPAMEQELQEFASDGSRDSNLRALAIRMLSAEAEEPTDQQLAVWVMERKNRAIGIEAIRLMGERATNSSLDQLAILAEDLSLDEQTRADAIAALSRNAGVYAEVLNRLALPKQPEPIRQEASRVLKRRWQDESAMRPGGKDTQEWMKLVGSGGDVDAGRRVFFRAACAKCHTHSGRGARTGPDLTTVGRGMAAERILESILQPSREVAPMYVPWKILTVDGHVLTGLKLGAAGVGHRLRFQDADGLIFEVPLDDIEQQDPIEHSIMPSGLEETVSIEELRDLIAFLAR